MRVVQIVQQLAVVGGVQTYVTGLTRHLVGEGHYSVILTGDNAHCASASEVAFWGHRMMTLDESIADSAVASAGTA